MDPDTIKKIIAMIDERVRAKTEHMKTIAATIQENRDFKETLVAKLKGAEQDAKKPKRKKR